MTISGIIGIVVASFIFGYVAERFEHFILQNKENEMKSFVKTFKQKRKKK
jgi:hypothetical protein